MIETRAFLTAENIAHIDARLRAYEARIEGWIYTHPAERDGNQLQRYETFTSSLSRALRGASDRTSLPVLLYREHRTKLNDLARLLDHLHHNLALLYGAEPVPQPARAPGRRANQRVDIDMEELERQHWLGYSASNIAANMRVSERTIRRRKQEAGLGRWDYTAMEEGELLTVSICVN